MSIIDRVTRFCNLSILDHTVATRKGIVKMYRDSGQSMADFCDRHCLSKGTLGYWNSKYNLLVEKGIDMFYDKGGRPPLLDATSELAVTTQLINATKDQRSIRKRDFSKLCSEQAVENRKRRNIGVTHLTISPTTSRRYKARLNVGEKQGQFKTQARIEAERDPRNAYSMIAMATAFSSQLSPHMIFNWDATQFVINGDGEKSMVYIKGELDSPLTHPGSGGLNFAIKLYHFHCAAGFPAIPVFIVAVDSLDEDDLICHKVLGLSNNTAPSSYGYLCFTKTRCCNKKFYSWFASTVVCPFVEQQREDFECKVYRYLKKEFL